MIAENVTSVLSEKYALNKTINVVPYNISSVTISSSVPVAFDFSTNGESSYFHLTLVIFFCDLHPLFLQIVIKIVCFVVDHFLYMEYEKNNGIYSE